MSLLYALFELFQLLENSGIPEKKIPYYSDPFSNNTISVQPAFT